MLIEFTVGNYLSFKEPNTLNLEATGISEHPENIAEVGNQKLLKSAVIYGANASGKSNLIKAFNRMRELVLTSSQGNHFTKLDITPYLLDKEPKSKVSIFEILFRIESIQYRYGFEADNNRIHGEWLFQTKKTKEYQLFNRYTDDNDKDIIDVKERFKEGKNLIGVVRTNALFLTTAEQFNGQIATSIITWFKNAMSIKGDKHTQFGEYTISDFANPKQAKKFMAFYKALDLGFDSIELRREHPKSTTLSYYELEKDKLNLGDIAIKTSHRIFHENVFSGWTQFDMRDQESKGTNKLFDLTGVLFSALDNGTPLIIDELDASLHPLLVLSIIRIFDTQKFNPKNAQLIFTTHDANILQYGRLRRDQVYFVEKNPFGASKLYSLVEFKPRKDSLIEKDYIYGKFGAIPYMGKLSDIFGTWQEDPNLTEEDLEIDVKK